MFNQLQTTLENSMLILYNSKDSLHTQTVNMAKSMNRLVVNLVDLNGLSTDDQAYTKLMQSFDNRIDWRKLEPLLPDSIRLEECSNNEIFDHFIEDNKCFYYPIGIHNFRAYYLPMPSLYMQEVWKDDKFTPTHKIKDHPEEP